MAPAAGARAEGAPKERRESHGSSAAGSAASASRERRESHFSSGGGRRLSAEHAVLKAPSAASSPVPSRPGSARPKEKLSAGSQGAAEGSARPKDESKTDKTDKASKIIAAFRSFDVNGDGVMDRSEMARLCWALNQKFTDEQLNQLFDHMDVNQDGLIQYEEFVRWLFGDDKTLSQLKPGEKAMVDRSTRLQVHLRDGGKCAIQAVPEETVDQLRLRVCSGLGLPVACIPELHLRYAGSEADVPLCTKACDLEGQDLLVVVGATGCVTGAGGRRIRQWRVERMEEIFAVEAPAEVREVVTITHCGVLAALCGKGTVVAWETPSGRELWRLDRGPLAGLAAGRQAVIAGTEDGGMVAWDALGGKQLWAHGSRAGPDGIQAMHVCPEAMDAVCGASEGGSITCLEASTGKVRWEKHHGADIPEVRHVTGASRRDAAYPEAIFTGTSRGLVCAWDCKTGRQRWNRQIVKDGNIQALFYRECHDTISVASDTGEVFVLDGRTGEQLFAEPLGKVQFMLGRRQSLIVATSTTVSAWDTLNSVKSWEVDVFLPPSVSPTRVSTTLNLSASAGPSRVATATNLGQVLPPSGAQSRTSTLNADALEDLARGNHNRRVSTTTSIAEAMESLAAVPGIPPTFAKAGQVTALAFAEDVDLVCLGTTEGLAVYSMKTGHVHSVREMPSLSLLAYTHPS